MKLRLETLKACHGHVRARRARERSDRHRRRSKRTVRKVKKVAQFDGPQYAFRENCSDSLSLMPPTSNLGSEETSSSSDSSPTSGAISSATTLPEFIDPKLIFIGTTKTDLLEIERTHSSSPTSLSFSTGEFQSKVIKRHTPPDGLTKPVSDIELQPKMLASNNNVASIAEHIAKVSSFSGVSSTRSSLMSWVSRISSRISTSSSLEFGTEVASQPETELGIQFRTTARHASMPVILYSIEQDVLIDLVGNPTAVAYSSMSFGARPCCGGSAKSCIDCGLSIAYYDFRSIPSGRVNLTKIRDQASATDYYGNTLFTGQGTIGLFSCYSTSLGLLFAFLSLRKP
jgi:hypothetical protein